MSTITHVFFKVEIYFFSFFAKLFQSNEDEMPLSVFKTLFAEAKKIKLVEAFKKINNKLTHSKWIFTCCRNYSTVAEIFSKTLHMNIRMISILVDILKGNQEIEEKPACYKNTPSVGGLDFLVSDFEGLLDLIVNSLESRNIYDHEKFNKLFELAHTLYNFLKSFRTSYISKVYDMI